MQSAFTALKVGAERVEFASFCRPDLSGIIKIAPAVGPLHQSTDRWLLAKEPFTIEAAVLYVQGLLAVPKAQFIPKLILRYLFHENNSGKICRIRHLFNNFLCIHLNISDAFFFLLKCIESRSKFLANKFVSAVHLQNNNKKYLAISKTLRKRGSQKYLCASTWCL